MQTFSSCIIQYTWYLIYFMGFWHKSSLVKLRLSWMLAYEYLIKKIIEIDVFYEDHKKFLMCDNWEKKWVKHFGV